MPTDDAHPPDPAATDRPLRRRRGRVSGWLAVLILSAAALTAGLFLTVTGRAIHLPGWAVSRIEASLAPVVAPARLRLGTVRVNLAPDGDARVELADVTLFDGGGAGLAQVDRIEADFSIRALLSGQRLPRDLTAAGVRITLRRASDGRLSMDLGGVDGAAGDPDAGGGGHRAAMAGTAGEVLDQVAAALRTHPFRAVRRVAVSDLTVALEDARSGRVWQATEGSLTLRNRARSADITVFTRVFNGTETLAPVQFLFKVNKDTGAAAMQASIREVAAKDIAAQTPALAALDLLDAPVSGSVRAQIGAGGELSSLAATLDIAPGHIRPAPTVPPVAFDGGRLYAQYDPRRERIAISSLALRAEALSLEGQGVAYLRDVAGGRPRTILAQLRFDRIGAQAASVLAAPVSFAAGHADLRLTLDPFRIEVGQAVLIDGTDRAEFAGEASVGPAGWHLRARARAEGLASARALALWPVNAAPKLRDFLTRSIPEGRLSNISAALDLRPRDTPEGPSGSVRTLGLSFDFADATMRWLPEMPPLRDASGYAALTGDRFALHVDRGMVDDVALHGSSMTIADLRQRPAQLDLDLDIAGPLGSVLQTLDAPPIRALSRAGRSPDIASGQVAGRARISLPLRKLAPGDVDFDVAATVTGAVSEGLVPGRDLTADRLEVAVDPAMLRLSGGVRLDGMPADMEAHLRLRRDPEDADAIGTIRGTAPFDTETLAAFGVVLPAGMLTGRSSAGFGVDLRRGSAPTLSLASGLDGIALSIPALGWTKGPEQSGALDLAITLSGPPSVDRIVLRAPGLSADGRIALDAEGRFASATFDSVDAGWLNAPVTLLSQGPGRPPRIRVSGGSLDLTRRPEAGADGDADPVPIEAALDRLRITEGIAIAPFRGNFVAGPGIEGAFTGRVNGGKTVRGSLSPRPGGTMVRVVSDDAGRLLRDAGLFKSLEDGAFDLTLMPVPRQGGYDGTLRIGQARLRDQPILVDMLDAVSVVGIIDQITGPGILFDEIEAQFRLSGDRLVVESGRAVGASLGVTLDGVYDLAAKQLDMGGVVSPVYLLNSIGQIFTRRGEGLFGFTFRLAGNPEAPSVSVNPLSILTPGMFREIFRRPPPSRGGARTEGAAAETGAGQ